MRAILLVALIACDSTKDPATPGPTVAPKSAPKAKRFPRVAKADRPAAAAAIAKQFPAAWIPKVTADYAGMLNEVVLELPEAPADPVDRAYEIIQEHASVFGVAGELHHELDKNMIRIGAGNRWTGQIVARFDDNKLTIYGHLWPIDVQQVAIKPDVEKVVSPYYGIAGQFLSRCLDCKDFSFVIDKSSFSFIGGMALVCTPEGIFPRALIAIDTHWKAGSRITGIEQLPGYLDPKTLAPVEIDPNSSVFFPGDGTFANGKVTYAGAHGFDYAGCFDE